MRTKLFQVVSLFALPIVISVVASRSVAAAPESLCKIFAQLSRRLPETPPGGHQTGLDRYQLWGTYNQAVEHFDNFDIDGDDISDLVRKSCPGSNEPGDPCMLTIKLSAAGEELHFEAWGFRLFRYSGRFYIAANADSTRKQTNIFKITKSGIGLICEKL